MVEEIILPVSPEDEWTQSREDVGNEDSQQITETITHHVINILNVTVLVIIGFILSKFLGRKILHSFLLLL